MIEHINSSIIDKESDVKGVDEYVAELFREIEAGGELSKLSEEAQGKAVVDRFVGALIRQGDVEDSSANTHRFEQTLFDMHRVAKGAPQTSVTRAGGRRGAVLALVENPLTARAAEQAYEDILHDERGTVLLASEDQIEGYLRADEQQNVVAEVKPGVHMTGSQWVNVLEEQVSEVMNKNGVWIYNKHKGIIESDIPDLRDQGYIWLKAVNSAEKCGVDVALLGKSAELICESNERRAQLSRRLGGQGLERA